MSAIGRLACEAACNPSNVNTYGWGILVGTAALTILGARCVLQIKSTNNQRASNVTQTPARPDNPSKELNDGINEGDLEKVKNAIKFCKAHWVNLKTAAEKGHRKIVKALIPVTSELDQCLANACHEGLTYLVDKIIKSKLLETLDYAMGILQRTPLEYAIESGNDECCKALIEGGANANFIPSSRSQYLSSESTAFLRACRLGNCEIVALFLRNREKMTLDEKTGALALKNALHQPALLDLLLKYKVADVNAQVAGKDRALNIAAAGGDVISVQMLLKAGANKNLTGDGAYTPLDTAIQTLNVSDPPDEKRKGLKAVIELLT